MVAWPVWLTIGKWSVSVSPSFQHLSLYMMSRFPFFSKLSNYQAFLSACCSKSLGHNFRGLVYFSHRYLSESISDKVHWAVAQRKYQQLKIVSNMGMGHWKREGRWVRASCSQEQWTNCSWGSPLLMKLYP